MSEPVTALNSARYETGIAEVSEIGPLGMITLRGDLSAAFLRSAATRAADVDLPQQRMCHSDGDNGIAWMSPDELLVMCAYADVPAKLIAINKAIHNHHALAANVSDARAVFRIRGPHARDVMAKLSPVDLHPDHFTPGMFRRTRLAQVPAAFWMRDAETFQVICFRSVASYVFEVLKMAAQPGSETNYF